MKPTGNHTHRRLLATLVVTVVLGGVPTGAATQEITISLDNGYLSWTNTNPALYYTVEFRPNLTGGTSWDGTYGGLRNIQSSDSVISVPVGVFYRVKGTTSPVYSSPGTATAADLLAGKTAWVNDLPLTGTMADRGAVSITPGTTAQTIAAGYHNGSGSVSGDSNLAAGNIKKDVTIFGVTGTFEGSGGSSGPPAPLPKTGQISTYRTGDDGAHQKGVAWPSPRFTNHGNGTVTDNLTGLMWTQDANLLNDFNNMRNWNDAVDYCHNLNHAGYSDWRLPNVREMLSLIDYGRSAPALPTGHPFSNVNAWVHEYWTSTTDAGVASTIAWQVEIQFGQATGTAKTQQKWVWPVRDH